MILRGIVVIILLCHSCAQATFKRLNYSGKDVDLKEVFAVIKNQTGVLFFYDAALLRDTKPVTVHWKNQRLETALDEIFAIQPVTWVKEQQTITLIKRPP